MSRRLRREDGSVTLWLLGLSVLLLGLGGIGLDLWRVQVVRADLRAAADAATTAGAGRIDTDAFRRDGTVVLDADPTSGAAAAAWAVLAGATGHAERAVPTVTAAPGEIEVRLAATVPFGLLGLLLPPGERDLEVVVTSVAAPRERGAG